MLFTQLTGQDKIKQKLINSVKNKKISHAQLITGLPGSGGLPLALAFTQYIYCNNKTDNDACNQCDNCHKINKLIHPDLHFSYPVISKKSGSPPLSIDYINEWRKALLENPYLNYNDWLNLINAENKQGNITINECRSIIKKLSFKSYSGGYKTYIIWLPEFLGEAGNVLLKILEEPPEHTIFLLVTENPEMLLNTILSRTQLIPLEKLSSEQISTELISKFNLEESEARQIAVLSEGDYNEALKMYKSGFENDFFNDFSEWMRLCYKADLSNLLKSCEKIVALGREGQKSFLKYALHIFRECNIMQNHIEALNRLSANELEFVQNFSKVIKISNIFKITDLVNDSCYFIERNANSKILFFNLSLQINHALRKLS